MKVGTVLLDRLHQVASAEQACARLLRGIVRDDVVFVTALDDCYRFKMKEAVTCYGWLRWVHSRGGCADGRGVCIGRICNDGYSLAIVFMLRIMYVNLQISGGEVGWRPGLMCGVAL